MRARRLLTPQRLRIGGRLLIYAAASAAPLFLRTRGRGFTRFVRSLLSEVDPAFVAFDAAVAAFFSKEATCPR